MRPDRYEMKKRNHDIFERNAELDARLAEESPEQLMRDLAYSGRTNRRLIRVLAFSLFADVLLTIGLGGVGFVARQASERASTNANVTYQRCLTGNEFRRKDLSHWDDFLTLALANPSPNETSAQRTQSITLAAGLHKQIAKDDAPVPCVKPKP